MELTISLESLCRLLERLREYEAQVPAVDPDDGSNPTDDLDMDALEDENAEVVAEEIRAAVDDLADDEQLELVALVLVGRGAFDASEWDEALEAAEEEADDVADWLMDQPMAAALLDQGMAAFGLSCSDVGQPG